MNDNPIPSFIRGIYLSLDDLFDTRFPFMMSIDPDITRKIYFDFYRKRYCDEIIAEAYGLTREEWMMRWNDRPIDLYRNAIRSKMIGLVVEMLDGVDTMPYERGTEQRRSLTINTHPYLLTMSEKGALERTLKLILGPTTKIQWMRKSTDDITGRFFVENYSFIVLYHWQDWIYKHKDEEGGLSLTNSTFVVPKLYDHKLEQEDLEEIVRLKEKNIDPLTDMTEAFMAMAMNIKYQPSNYWDFPDNVKK